MNYINNKLTADNLNKLANYIESNVDQPQLDMANFRSTDGGGVDFMSINDCGTAGCALGHAPFAIPPIDSDFMRSGELNFSIYGSRNFPSLYHSSHEGNEHWDHVFHTRISSDKSAVLSRLRNKAKELMEIEA